MKQRKKKIKPLVNVLSIQPKDVERFWPLSEFMIKEALKYSGEYADPKHIYDLLKKDMMQCFIMFGSDELEENKVFGVGVTRISEMPNFNQFAKGNDCKRLCLWARPGWEKVSKKWGWQKKHVQLEKWISK